MVISPFQLESGESLIYRYTWEQIDNSGKPVPPGKYLVWGEISTVPGISSGVKEIKIQ